LLLLAALRRLLLSPCLRAPSVPVSSSFHHDFFCQCLNTLCFISAPVEAMKPMDMAKAVAVAAIVASPLLAGATEGTNEVGAVRNRLFTLGRLLITCYHHILFLYVCVSIDLRSKLRQDLLFLHPHSCSRPFPRPCFQRLGKRSIKRGFLRRDRPSERLNAFILRR